MPKTKPKDPRPTPRTTAVVDGLIDLGARFGAVHPAQSVLLPNGKIVWMIANADDVAAGRAEHEFVDVLVPLTDTINIYTMLGEVRKHATPSHELSTKDVYAAQCAAGEAAPLPAIELADTGVPAKDLAQMMRDANAIAEPIVRDAGARVVKVANRGAYDVQVATAHVSGIVRYAVRSHASGVLADVVYNRTDNRNREGVVCVLCQGDDCAHADAVRMYRLATAAHVADPASGD